MNRRAANLVIGFALAAALVGAEAWIAYAVLVGFLGYGGAWLYWLAYCATLALDVVLWSLCASAGRADDAADMLYRELSEFNEDA